MLDKKIAVICSSGIGDALIFSIASHHLKKLGASVTTFHDLLSSFGNWLEPGDYRPRGSTNLLSYDAILLQHDNTPFAHSIAALRKEIPVYIFYPSYRPSKHLPLTDFDYAFDEEKTMVDNVCIGLTKLFGGEPTKKNSLTPPSHLIHKKHPTRIVIHPTSGAAWRNWTREKFLKIADHLQKKNFHPQFVVSPAEHSAWPSAHVPHSLKEFASYLYESGAFLGNNSGPGHLASYLSIPHIILAHQEQHMKLWTPGWLRGTILLPPKWLPKRWRERNWQKAITFRKVAKNLELLLHLSYIPK